ncbi:MAG: AAA family ATPase [Desulfobaccales bacterium]
MTGKTKNNVYTPPASLEAEQSVLGAILVTPEKLGHVASIVTREDFYREANGHIFKAMLDLHGRGDPVDLVTVSALLKERGQLEGVGGPVFLAGLSEEVGFATNAGYYAHLIRRKADIRRLLDRTQEIASACLAPVENMGELFQLAESKIFEITESYTSKGLHDFPPLDGSIIPLSQTLKNPPPPREYLFKEVLPAGIVGEVVAVGGTGKGFLMFQLGLALATGLKVGPLEPARKIQVLYLAAEDSSDEIQRRAYSVTQALWPDGQPPLEIDNFIPVSIAGKLGPLMAFKGANPVTAPAYDWLAKTLENMPRLRVLILDPKSKFYGLDENDNTHCSAWISCLEALAARFKITILFTHHESKAKVGSMDQGSSRGGSALTDGCRWVANVKTMDNQTAKKYLIDTPRNFVVLDVTKSNYAPKLPGPIYFRRGEGGALSHVDLEAERVRGIGTKFLHCLA